MIKLELSDQMVAAIGDALKPIAIAGQNAALTINEIQKQINAQQNPDANSDAPKLKIVEPE